MRTFFGSSIAFCALVATSSHANPAQICDDLQRFICAPGSYDDGTGSASNPTVLSSGQSEIEQKIAKRAHDEFLKALKDPDNTYFRKTVLSATGLSLSPHCAKAEDHPSAKCLSDMATGLVDIFSKQQGSNPYQTQAYAMGAPAVTDTTFVTESPIYEGAVQRILDHTKELLHAEDIDKKARDKVFPQIKTLLLSKIKQMVKDPTVRKNLTDKVKAIRYDSSDCSGGTTSVPGLLMPNAFYNPSKNTFNFCSGMTLQNKSEFQMAFVMAHELAHSIDPCCITQGPSDFSFQFPEGGTRADAEAAYPIQGVIACLRSEQSVKARAADQVPQVSQSQGNYGGYGNYGNYGNYGGTGGGMVNNSQPQAPPPFAGFCQNDQITESFADWMAAEITPEYISKNYPKLSSEQRRFGYSNIWRGSCMDDATARQIAVADPHPAQGDRSNRILLVQPKIRAQMNCPKTPPRGTVYCAPPGFRSSSVPIPRPTPEPDMEGVVK